MESINSKNDFLEKLLYDSDENRTCKMLADISDPEVLFGYIYHYNWDNGFHLPQCVLNNKNCDMSTALLTFYRADGIQWFNDKNGVIESGLQPWISFLEGLYNRLLSDAFLPACIEYIPELTKVQIFKIKKAYPELPEFFTEGFSGKAFSWPYI